MTVAASFSATLVDEWVRAGLTDAVVAPGSRSTPLVVALARESRMALHVRLDERSAAFFALGIGLATGRPAVLVTTSGTAAVEVHAAVVEAHLSRVPLIVCTADRPPELHHVGAPQTIEQSGLFAGALRWAVDPGVPDEQARSELALARQPPRRGGDGRADGPGPGARQPRLSGPALGSPGELPAGPAQRPALAPGRAVSKGARPGLARRPRPPARPTKGLIVAGAGAGRPETVRRLASTLGLARPRRPALGRPHPGRAGLADDRRRRFTSSRRELRRRAPARGRPPPRRALGVQGRGRLAGVMLAAGASRCSSTRTGPGGIPAVRPTSCWRRTPTTSWRP